MSAVNSGTSQAQQDYAELCGTIHTPAIAEALERARVVGVLDAWAVYRGPAGRGGQWYVVQDTVCALHVLPPGAESELPVRYFDGETPDAARAAAAKAIERRER